MAQEPGDKEYHRTRTTQSLRFSDRGRDEVLKKFLRLACQLVGINGSYIAVLNDDKHSVRANYNIELSDTTREQALCRHVVESDATVIAPDTRLDPRYAHHPLIVHAPYIRFYVGTPLKNAHGQILGTLCLTDTVPRTFSHQQKQIIESLAGLVVAFLEAWHSAAFIEPVTGMANRERLFRDILHLATLNDTALRRLVLIDCIDMSRAYDLSRSLGMASLESLLKDVATLLRLRLRPASGESIYTIATGRFAILTRAESHVSAKWVEERLNGIHADMGDGLTMALATCTAQIDFIAGQTFPQDALRRAVNALERVSGPSVRLCDAVSDGIKDASSPADFTLMRDLADALRRNQGLYLVFQPNVCLLSGKPVSLEAQIRWHHPQRGELAADNFTSLAVGTELGTTLTTWLIDSTIARLKRLRNHPIQLPVTISIHERDVTDRAFAEKLAEKMLKATLPVSMLVIKIVQKEHIIDSPSAMLGLEMLRRMGFTMTWEYIAKGYRKIRYLRGTPPDVIKLDKALANEIHTNITSRLIAHSIFTTLKELNLLVLAYSDRPASVVTSDNSEATYEYFNIKPMTETELDPWLKWKLPG
ncbi:histidine kinase [Pantoea stewartii]|uniref:EAL domain-containing protein n=1 Tax=Pantoea stewartii TaxID=66269 RepID=UPI000542BFB0|nr:EAL domain-containing protein [Pantoea stewartii]KHE01197.1 histidine kinase [Pantoea stewartii]KHN63492.1 histidine kinase [Pantoea stewartii]